MSPLNNLLLDKIPFTVTYHGEGLAVSHEVKAGTSDWHIPEEVPIAFVFNRRNYAVMMGTPHDLTEFAVGFSLTEGIIQSLGEVISLDIYLSELGADLRFKISEEALDRLDTTQRRRNIIGSASCGLCGLENAETLFKKLPIVSKQSLGISEDVMSQAMNSMPKFQALNSKTHSVHGAAWVDLEGNIKDLREDVGRHNALDKLLGVLAIGDENAQDGFVLMSSRCSYEIVEKAARRGIQAILSISGPTSFALRKAKEANMAIYSRSGKGAVRLL